MEGGIYFAIDMNHQRKREREREADIPLSVIVRRNYW